jgi:hypothetical protein
LSTHERKFKYEIDPEILKNEAERKKKEAQ